jgi:3-hydroxyisobutyrate dehydrogenase-like beta-hydroxyacid dehydrogenase
MKVAFIGLGKMGSAIAGNIARHGFDLTVWNRSPEKTLSSLAPKPLARPKMRLRKKT